MNSLIFRVYRFQKKHKQRYFESIIHKQVTVSLNLGQVLQDGFEELIPCLRFPHSFVLPNANSFVQRSRFGFSGSSV